MDTADVWTKSPYPGLHDYVVIAVYLILIFVFAKSYQNKKEPFNHVYRYFTWGLFARIFGAIALCLVYEAYYGSGDTVGFYRSSETMVNLLFQNPGAYFRILFGEFSPEVLSKFSRSTGFPWYMDDYEAFSVSRFTSIFTFFGFKNYFSASILFATFFFQGYWKLFLLLNKIYPKYQKEFAFAVFFFPSVLFWGSGILKDTVTLSMTAWFVYSVYHVFIFKENRWKNSIAMILTGYLIIAIKPYIMIALVPGAFIWLAWSYVRKYENIVLRIITAPLVTAIFISVGFLILMILSPSLGVYGSVDGIIKKATVTYDDHTRAYAYGENFYDLGELEPSVAGLISKAPLAIFTGLFRPLPWEARNFFMALAALENVSFLIFVLVIIWRTGFVKTIKIAFDEPLVIFSLSFALFFAFGVGISSGNFGALVRLKIPMLPFLAAGLFTLYRRAMEIKKGVDIRSQNY